MTSLRNKMMMKDGGSDSENNDDNEDWLEDEENDSNYYNGFELIIKTPETEYSAIGIESQKSRDIVLVYLYETIKF
jgi:hypothetical protein